MSRTQHRGLFFLASFWLLFAGTLALGDVASILTLSGSPISGTHLGPFVEFVQDGRTEDQFESIRADWRSLPLQHRNSDHINLGAAAKPHWFRFVIQLQEPQKIILEHDYPVDLLDVFHRPPNHPVQSFELGYRQDSASRLDYRHPSKVLDLEPGLHEFFLRLEHKGAVRFSLRVWSNDMFVLAKARHELTLGIILGISVLMVFYNIFLYAMVRSRVYLHYVGYLCCQTFFLLFYSGLSQQLGTSFKWLANNFWVSSILLTAFFLQRFTRIFLNLPGRMPRFDSVFCWSSYFLLCVAALERFDQNWAFLVFHIALIPSILLCLAGAALSAFRGYRPAWFYLISFLSVIIGSVVENFVVAGQIDPKYSFWVYFSSYSLQMVLLSLAIGDQIHLEQIKTLKTVEHLSRNLQEEVKSQTLTLEVQRDKLIEQKKELAQTHEELQNHDKQKTRFFENISHELRTPLTLILGSLAHAREELVSCKPVQVADRNAKRLLRLVNQLLDFQKLNSGEAELDLRKIDLMAFLNSICQYFQPVCEQKKVRFHLDLGSFVEKDRPVVMVQIDALEKIVFNYLSNALKFTPQGGEIYLRFVLVGPKARVQVDDSGPGIPPDELSRLFRVFSQGNGPAKREFEGTGLGLALAKELAHQMGGDVGVQSEPGKGSSFWVDLPLCLDRKRTVDLLVIDS
ncbi:MAG: sensor histidine kinase, partial [Pseudobdellovibrionaceae bacterium]|nr:sensor histidine kinase [Pseudobdellovibrionaceae bacterium]